MINTIKLINYCNENIATEIIKGLWLGDYIAANDKVFLTDNKIEQIISICKIDIDKFFWIKYINIHIDDNDICINNNKINSLFQNNKIFNITNQFIDNALKNGKNILVHCKRGHHRSAVIIAAYLIYKYNLSLFDSIKYIKSKRPNSFRRETCMYKKLKNYYYEKK
jgi:dual specificity phosphatase 12